MPKRLQENETARHQLNRPPWIYFLFLFSGVASLIYQIVWVRMLTLVFGHTIYSVSIVLSAFMAGLGLGSYLFGKELGTKYKKYLFKTPKNHRAQRHKTQIWPITTFLCKQPYLLNQIINPLIRHSYRLGFA